MIILKTIKYSYLTLLFLLSMGCVQDKILSLLDDVEWITISMQTQAN